MHDARLGWGLRLLEICLMLTREFEDDGFAVVGVSEAEAVFIDFSFDVTPQAMNSLFLP